MPVSLFRSSAGSGKTFTLVREYLRLVLPNPDSLRETLAITFTNEATREMKERVIETLIDIANHQKGQLAQKVISDIGDPDKAKIYAATLLSRILHQYNHFSISTIDSFFTRIIRPFSRELNLPVNFEIQLDEDEVLNEITDKLMVQAADRDELKSFFIHFIQSNLQNGRSWNLENEIKHLGREILKERSIDYKPQTLQYISSVANELNKLCRDFENRMQQFADKGMKVMDTYSVQIRDFKYGKSGPANYFYRISKNLKDYEPKNRVRNALEGPLQLHKANDEENVIKAAEELHPLLIDAVDYFDEHHTDYETAFQLIRNIYTLGVWQEFSNMLEAKKKEKNIVLISDLNRVIYKHLLKEPVPFIYSYAGIRFKHFFLDEFQDTSRMQWNNLYPLLENAAAEGGNTLIVGDAKQAIYRWRSGDPEIMESEVEASFPFEIEQKSLDYNFRSLSNIVGFNNHFFSKCGNLLKENAPDTVAGKVFTDNAEQKTIHSEKKGMAKVLFPERGSNMEETISECNELLGYQLEALFEDGFNYDDILLLVRDNKDAGNLAQFLLSKDIPCFSDNALYLENAPVIRLIISLLNYFGETGKDFSIREAAFIYQHYLQDSGQQQETKLMECSSHPEQCFPEAFNHELESLKKMPLYELTEQLINIFAPDLRNDAYIISFLSVLNEYRKNHGTSVKGFCSWWKEGKHTISTGSSRNIIHVMTIHKAKGLEFPAVILPYAHWPFQKPGKGELLWVEPDREPFNKLNQVPVNSNRKLENTWFQSDYFKEQQLNIQDNINMMYVAFTRAIERLIIISPRGITNSAASWIRTCLNYEKDYTGEQYVFGDRHPKISEADEEEIAEQIPFVKLSGHTPGVNAVFQADTSIPQEAEEGKIMHDMLAKIKYRDQIESTLQQYSALETDSGNRLKSQLDKLLELEGTQKWLPRENECNSNNCMIKTEHDVLLPDGSIYRPDRVVLYPEETFIIDFKTGSYNPSHEQQLLQYRNVLDEMGYSFIQTIAVYLGNEPEQKIFN